MVPVEILLRLSRIQAELAALLAALPSTVPVFPAQRAAPSNASAAAAKPSPKKVWSAAPARWGFTEHCRYQITGPSPFEPGRWDTRFQALINTFGDSPFTFGEMLSRLTTDGDVPTKASLVGLLQLAKKRGAIVPA